MIARLALAALILDLVLIQPNHPGAMTWGALRLFPLELPVILAVMLVWPGRVLRGALVLWLAASVVLKGADLGFFLAFDRGFNPVADLPLIGSAWTLASGAFGAVLAGGIVAGIAVVLVGLAWVLWWATGQWARLAVPRWGRAGAGLVAALSLALAVAEAGWAMRLWPLPFQPPGAAFTARLTVERAILSRDTLAALDEFERGAEQDPSASLAAPLARLSGRDILVVFIESYGRASLDNSLYAPAHTAILRQAGTALAARGLAARTAWLSSPVEGGQSWLAHATLASGLRIGDAGRNAALLSGSRRTIWQVARDAGWRTAAVSPAITMPWPEGARLGFEVLLDRDAMGYRGPAFNWITMPDQFTLARFRDRLPPDPRPLAAQITLISSHAPWVPVPVPLPWDQIGEGETFGPMAASGDPPEVVWQDPDRIRAQYRDAIGYSLTVALDWAARAGDPAPLVLILGDHQAAGFVSQVGGVDVPAHLIGPPEVLALTDGWGWTSGLVPGASTPEWPMEAFRDRFLQAFSGAP